MKSAQFQNRVEKFGETSHSRFEALAKALNGDSEATEVVALTEVTWLAFLCVLDNAGRAGHGMLAWFDRLITTGGAS